MRAGVLSDADRAGALPVVVITQDLADKYFPGVNPIGQRVRLGRNPAWPWWTIVGVVPPLSSAPQGDAIIETAFVPLSQAPDRALTMLAATTGDPLAAAPGVRQAMRAVDQDVPHVRVGVVRRADASAHLAVPRVRHVVHGVRRARAPDGGGGPLRRAGVRRATADAGDRRADGARRRTCQRRRA